MERLIVEIRAGEGGNDAKDLVREQFSLYCKYAAVKKLVIEILEEATGFVSFSVQGRGAGKAFAMESGGMRWQHVPKHDKRGRVQTSTVTVAVLEEPKEADLYINESDIEWQTCRGSGAGGQHRNVTNSAVQMKHLPTGISVRVENERSQHQNKEAAYRVLRARIHAQRQQASAEARDSVRRLAVGSGERGDKVRTIREQDDRVTDHRSNRQIRYKDYIRGNWDGLLA
jgi:peptide chain release factor 1